MSDGSLTLSDLAELARTLARRYWPLLLVLLALALIVSLAGCGGVQSTPAPPTEVRTVTVNVPIATPCVSASNIPAGPPHVGSRLNGDSVHDLDVVAAIDLRLRAALGKALALLGACAR